MISIAKLNTKSQAVENVVHILLAMQVFLKGWDKAEHFHKYPLRVIFLFLMGLLIVAGVVFHHKIEKRIKNFDGFFHIFESLVFFTVATIYWEEGSRRIPVFLFFIGGIYLIMGLLPLLSKNPDRDAIRFRLMFILGVLFLIAAAATVSWNLLTVHSGWLIMMAVLFTVGGIFLLWLRYTLMRKKRKKTESGSTGSPAI